MKTMKLWMILSLGAWLAMSCTSNKETQTEETETTKVQGPQINGEEVTYSTTATEMKGYLATDVNKEGKRPGVLVVHEWWGHNDYVRKRADMLAEMGYVAIAVDMYGDGKQAEHPEDAGKFSGQVFENIDEAKARFEAAMETLKAHPDVDQEQIAAIGYCFGGSVVLSMANAGYDLDAVAAFHAGVALPIPPSEEIQAKILVANGADDPFVPEEQVQAYKQAMDAAGADYRYIAYPGAVHAFTSPEATAMGEKFDLPLAYNKEADEQSWDEMKKLFNSVFNK